MNEETQKPYLFNLENDTDTELVVWIEPWPEKVTLAPKSEMKIRLSGNDGYLHQLVCSDAIQIYVEGDCEPVTVEVDGKVVLILD